MTEHQIIDIADKAYPDGLVADCAAGVSGLGDALAEFIALELKSTYVHDGADKVQLRAAMMAMRTARMELQAVEMAFVRAYNLEQVRALSDGVPV